MHQHHLRRHAAEVFCIKFVVRQPVGRVFADVRLRFFTTAMHISLIALFLSLLVPTRLHEFHTSLAEVHYNPSGQALEVSLRVFTDDLESALSRDNGGKIIRVTEAAAADPFIKSYLAKNFSLIDDGNRRHPVMLLGKEITSDVTWLYFEIRDVESLAGKRLQNAVLTELFDDQINMVNLITPAGKRSFLFKPGETIQSLAGVNSR